MAKGFETRALSLIVAGAMVLSVPLGAFADTYDLAKGDIEIRVEKRVVNEETGETTEDVWVKQTGDDNKEYLSEDATKEVKKAQGQDKDQGGGTDNEETQAEVPSSTTDTITRIGDDTSKSDADKEKEKADAIKEAEDAKTEGSVKRVYDKVKGLLQESPLVIKQEKDSGTTDNTIKVKSTDEGTQAEFTIKDLNVDMSNITDTSQRTAIDVDGESAVISVEGNNTITNGTIHVDSGDLTIKDSGKEESTDSLVIKRDKYTNNASIGTKQNEDLTGSISIEGNLNIEINDTSPTWNKTGDLGHGASIGTGAYGNIKENGSILVNTDGTIKINTIERSRNGSGAGIGTGYTGSITDNGKVELITSGKATISGSNGGSNNSMGGAAIGTGDGGDLKDNSQVNVTVKSGGYVTLSGGREAAGLGTGAGDTYHKVNTGGSMMDNASINIQTEKNATLIVKSGSGGVDIGTGEGNAVYKNGVATGEIVGGQMKGNSSINIWNAGTIKTDNSGSYDYGQIGAEKMSDNSSINIHMTDGTLCSVIGSSSLDSTAGSIKIDGTGGKIKALGSTVDSPIYSMAGIGGNNTSIEIGGDVTVDATGGKSGAAAIGGNYGGAVKNILITGGKIIATAGGLAPAIGNGVGSTADAPAVTIGSDVELYAYSNAADGNVIQKNDATSSITNNILNGVFKNKLITKSNNFVVWDENGLQVNSFSLPSIKNHELLVWSTGSKWYTSSSYAKAFAIRFPKDGTYYILDSSGNYGYSIVGYDITTDDASQTKISYEVAENAISKDVELYFPSCKLTYQFESDNTENELPEEITEKTPKTRTTSVTTTSYPKPKYTDYYPSYENVKVDGGTWSFIGWKPSVGGIVNNKLTGVSLTGVWTYTADPPPEPEPVAPDIAPIDPTNSNVIRSDDPIAAQRWYWVTALLDADESVGYTYEQIGSNLIVNADEAAQAAVLHVLLSGWAEHTEVQSITFKTAGKTTTLYASDMLGITTGEQLTLTHEYEKATLAVDGRDYTYLLGEAAA